MNDLHLLPKVRDSWSYLYLEHGKIDQDAKAIAFRDAGGKVAVPCANLNVLMLGPGTNITHAAVRALAENGCLLFWTGEEGVRFYAQGVGETRSARRLLRQARLWADPDTRLAVVIKMYRHRFAEPPREDLTLRQLRGMEGVRVREIYAQASRETGVEWQGRTYHRNEWRAADPINRALSCANSCLYGVCHAAIIAAGYSTGLGFIHTGKMLSFVYDIADLYKAEITIPVAFACVAVGTDDLERRVRWACREAFHAQRLLPRIVADIDGVLTLPEGAGEADFDADMALPGGLWDPEMGEVAGGVNQADVPEEGGDDGGAGAGAGLAEPAG